MTQQISAVDPRLKWSGHVSMEVTDEWVLPWRIQHEERDLYAPELVERAAMSAGVRVGFQSNTSSIELTFDTSEERNSIDLVVDGQLVESAETERLTSARFADIGTQNKSIELWMPQAGEFRIRSLAIDDESSVALPVDPQTPKWITYGSSITQCRLADSPTKTWPAIVARTRGYDLTCLGFGGQCHLDPIIARAIRDREADLISMCLGINIYGGSTLSERTFGPGILGFVKIVREKHPTTPIVLMSPIYSPEREDTPNEVGFTLKQMRQVVLKSVEILRKNGDDNISYIDGLDMFDPTNAHLLPDDLHPNSEGYGIMAQNLLKLLPTI